MKEKQKIKSIKKHPLYNLTRNNISNSINLVPIEYDEKPNYFEEYIYDYENRLVEEKLINNIGIIISQTNFNYDSKGNLISERFSNSNSSTIKNFLFNINNQLIEIKKFNGDDKLQEKTIYIYDDDNLLISNHIIDDKNKDDFYLKYDHCQRLIETRLYTSNIDGEIDEKMFLSMTTQEYLENGNKIVKEFVYGDQSLASITVYNDEHKIIEKTNSPDDHGNLTKYFYQNSLLTEEVYYSIFEVKTIFQSITLYIYDDKNILSEERNFSVNTNSISNNYYEYVFDEQLNWIKKYTFFSNPNNKILEVEGFYEEREILYFE